MIVGWTGHRPNLFADPAAAQAAVHVVARGLTAERYLVGGQRGVDTWAARAAIELSVPFTLVLPLEPSAFTIGWSDADRALLDAIVPRAQTVHVVGGEPASAYARRNELIARDAGLLVAVWTGHAGGGTAETIAFGRKHGTPVREVLLAASETAARAHGRGI